MSSGSGLFDHVASGRKGHASACSSPAAAITRLYIHLQDRKGKWTTSTTPNSTICMTLVLSTVRRTSFRFHEAAFLVCDRERFSLVVLAHINYKPTGFKSINPCPKSLAGGIHHIWGTQLQRELWRTLSLLKDTWMTQKRLKYKSIKHHDWTCDGSLEQPLWNQSQVAGWSFMAISTACCWQAALNIGDAASNQVYLSGRS